MKTIYIASTFFTSAKTLTKEKFGEEDAVWKHSKTWSQTLRTNVAALVSDLFVAKIQLVITQVVEL